MIGKSERSQENKFLDFLTGSLIPIVAVVNLLILILKQKNSKICILQVQNTQKKNCLTVDFAYHRRRRRRVVAVV